MNKLKVVDVKLQNNKLEFELELEYWDKKKKKPVSIQHSASFYIVNLEWKRVNDKNYSLMKQIWKEISKCLIVERSRTGMSGCETYWLETDTAVHLTCSSKPDYYEEQDIKQRFVILPISKLSKKLIDILESYETIDRSLLLEQMDNILYKCLKYMCRELKAERIKVQHPALLRFEKPLNLYCRKQIFHLNKLYIKDKQHSYTSYVMCGDRQLVNIPKLPLYLLKQLKQGEKVFLKEKEEMLLYNYNKEQDKEIFYYVKYDTVYGAERYKEHIHQPAMFYSGIPLDYTFEEILVKRRLGDNVFLDENNMKYRDKITIEPVSKEQLSSKLRFMNCKIMEEDDHAVLIPENNREIIVYHPEHGYLVLPTTSAKDKYYIFRIRYEQGGHD